METTPTDADLSVAIETSFTPAAIRLGCVVADGVGMTLILTRPTSVDCNNKIMNVEFSMAHSMGVTSQTLQGTCQ